MIEDLQDEFSAYSKPKKQASPKTVLFALVFILWLIFSAVYIFISLPKMRSALAETDAINIIKNAKSYRISAESSPYTLYFVNPSNGAVMPFEANVLYSGSDRFHDAIEGLLKGPTDSALSEGYLSYIAPGTKLLGLTVSSGYAFVDLSTEFASSSNMEMARKQILMTLSNLDESIKELVVLVNGTEI
ncbi:MAG: GerMN domain-containing protein [Sphaerochaetaceae bacterium]|nr:GerMN domain-containing protein [Sphaerochaetaceae bacterium]